MLGSFHLEKDYSFLQFKGINLVILFMQLLIERPLKKTPNRQTSKNQKKDGNVMDSSSKRRKDNEKKDKL